MVFLSLLCSVLLAVPAGERPDPADQGRIIDLLINDLGAAKYKTREAATMGLRRIGLPALKALERAAKSNDPEVRTRARKILKDVRLGITPEWPAELALLARHYNRLTDLGRRQDALKRIAAKLGAKAVPILIVGLAAPEPAEAESALNCLKRIDSEESARMVVKILTEPKTTFQKQALALARARLGETRDALQILSSDETDKRTRRVN